MSSGGATSALTSQQLARSVKVGMAGGRPGCDRSGVRALTWREPMASLSMDEAAATALSRRRGDAPQARPRMFGHLSNPARRTPSRPGRTGLSLSVLAHGAVLALLATIPVASPPRSPDRTAALIELLELSSTGAPEATAPSPDPRSVPTHDAEAPAPESRIAASVESAEGGGDAVEIEIPSPRLTLAAPPSLGNDSLPARPTDVDLPIFTAEEILGTGAPPRVLNPRAYARRLAVRYPPRQDRLGISGEVLVRFVVGVDGRVEPESVTVLSYNGEAFVLLTVKYLSLLRFRPAVLDGRAVRVSVDLPVRWTPPEW